MDIAAPPRKRRARPFVIGGTAMVLVIAAIAMARLGPATPLVDASGLWIDSVRLGDMVRTVHGTGTLKPEHLRFITAPASARVLRLLSESGQHVTPETALLELSSPDVQIQALQADQQLSAAEAALITLRASLQGQRLEQAGVLATTQTQYENAIQEASAAESLATTKLISTFEANNKRALAREMTTRVKIEQQRLDIITQTMESEISAQATQVQRLKAIASFQNAVLASLQVRAPEAGILQDLTLQLGQWVTAGTTLAKVVQPGQLKAVILIPETQSKDVRVGLPALIDTRNGLIRGHVARQDPQSQNGTVTVDVMLDGPLPSGAVPDLNVDGTIEVERINHTLFMGHPTTMADSGTTMLFKVEGGGKTAVRVPVILGKSSWNTVQIIRGLSAGDRIILSDMTQWNALDHIRLK